MKEKKIQIWRGQAKVQMLTSICWMVLGTVFQALPYYLIYLMISYVLQNTLSDQALELNHLLVLGSGLIVSVLLGMMMLAYGGVKIHKAAYNILYEFRVQVTEYMRRVHLGFFTKNASGKLSKIIGENIEAIEQFIAHMLPNIINGAVLLVLMLGFMFYLHVGLSVVILCYIILAFVFQGAIAGGKNVKVLMKEINELNTDISVNFTEMVHGIEEIKMFHTSESQLKGLGKSIDNYRTYAAKFLKRVTPFYEGYKAVITSLVPCIFPVVYWLISKDPMNVELIINMLMFILVTPALYPSILELIELGSDVLNVNLKLDEINELLNYEMIEEKTTCFEPNTYDISFENIVFGYDDHNIFNNFNMTIPNRSTIALIGSSGCGKTTLGHLLMNFFKLKSGDIKIGGVSIQQMSDHDLMASMSYVSQEVHLFSDSILNNITMGRVTQESKVVEVCRKARCLEFIEALPEGFDTKVGHNGMTLSGGESQRIAIARAMLKDAPILILDEPMASADTENEYFISEALKALSKDKTVISIAHRLKNIAHADQILVLEDGKIREQGNHETLMNQDSIYRYYYNMQQSIDHWHIGEVIS